MNNKLVLMTFGCLTALMTAGVTAPRIPVGTDVVLYGDSSHRNSGSVWRAAREIGRLIAAAADPGKEEEKRLLNFFSRCDRETAQISDIQWGLFTLSEVERPNRRGRSMTALRGTVAFGGDFAGGGTSEGALRHFTRMLATPMEVPAGILPRHWNCIACRP